MRATILKMLLTNQNLTRLHLYIVVKNRSAYQWHFHLQYVLYSVLSPMPVLCLYILLCSHHIVIDTIKVGIIDNIIIIIIIIICVHG